MRPVQPVQTGAGLPLACARRYSASLHGWRREQVGGYTHRGARVGAHCALPLRRTLLPPAAAAAEASQGHYQACSGTCLQSAPPLRLCSSCPPSPAPSPDALVTAPSLGCRDAERDFARWEPPAGPRRGCCAAPPLGTSRDQPGWEEAVGRGRCTAPSPSRSCLAPSGARRLGSWQRHTRCGPAMAETEIISPPYLPHISS